MNENPYESPTPELAAAGVSKNHSIITVLTPLLVAGALAWFLWGFYLILMLAFAAVLWLFALMLIGAFSARFQPIDDDADSQGGSHGPPGR